MFVSEYMLKCGNTARCVFFFFYTLSSLCNSILWKGRESVLPGDDRRRTFVPNRGRVVSSSRRLKEEEVTDISRVGP